MWYTAKNKKTQKILISEIEKFLESLKVSANSLQKQLFIYALDRSDFRWILINPVDCNIGITGIIDNEGTPIFGCICINSRKCAYYEAEGFTLDDMVKDNVVALTPAKDILGKLL
tara:strand:- start:607 stop:951 length:345 start_codon:yes stop_codon:yes gene_type:complete